MASKIIENTSKYRKLVTITLGTISKFGFIPFGTNTIETIINLDYKISLVNALWCYFQRMNTKIRINFLEFSVLFCIEVSLILNDKTLKQESSSEIYFNNCKYFFLLIPFIQTDKKLKKAGINVNNDYLLDLAVWSHNFVDLPKSFDYALIYSFLKTSGLSILSLPQLSFEAGCKRD
ncbi:hypothetical protein BpHYR1_044936 [Brachionus plicatilis]|uniref:Uncharacterized protein n=1 Tax=Brachionus plicatilis TaxID=10195 RepID=A0A3M7S0C6_BRAPC|nr:hypothetical protein BpHYR1_044936 [Brachionus plicatilis]